MMMGKIVNDIIQFSGYLIGQSVDEADLCVAQSPKTTEK